MTRDEAIARIDAVAAEPGFQANDAEAGSTVSLVRALPDDALAALRPDNIFATEPQGGSITLLWRAETDGLDRELAIISHGYGGFSVRSEDAFPPGLPWSFGPDRPGELFVGGPPARVAALLKGLFDWLFGADDAGFAAPPAGGEPVERPLGDRGCGRELVARASEALAVASVAFGRPDELFLQVDGGGATALYTTDEASGLGIALPRQGAPVVIVRGPDGATAIELPLARALAVLADAAARPPAPADPAAFRPPPADPAAFRSPPARVGLPAKVYPSEGADPLAAVVIRAHGDDRNRADLVAWCPRARAWVEHANVPADGAGPDGTPFWTAADAAD